MITGIGSSYFKTLLSSAPGGAISLGIGSTAASINDKTMEFEIARAAVSVVGFDSASGQLIYKATFSEETEGKIYEVGLWTGEVNAVPGSQGGRLLTTFDSVDEVWDIETFDSSATRIGADSLKHTPAVSSTSASILSGLNIDLSGYSSADTFVLAYQVDNTNCSSIKVRLRTDAANYYELTVSAPTVGYKVTRIPKASVSVVGVPDWADISEIEVRTTANSVGSASVYYDGIRIDDTDQVFSDYGLISRRTLPVPITKIAGQLQDVEFGIGVNIA